MNNVLLINPRGSIANFGNMIDVEKVKCYAVITTASNNFLSAEQQGWYEIYTPESLPADINFVSAVSSDVFGFRYLETISSRVMFSNAVSKSADRLLSFLVGKPKTECTVIETFSYYGAHVVSSAWAFDTASYSLLSPDETPRWEDLVDTAFERLEVLGYVNGPAQVFIDSSNTVIGVKYQMLDWMSETLSVELVGKYWLTHWPTVLADENANDKGFFKRFYEWRRSLKNSRSYTRLQEHTHYLT